MFTSISMFQCFATPVQKSGSHAFHKRRTSLEAGTFTRATVSVAYLYEANYLTPPAQTSYSNNEDQHHDEGDVDDDENNNNHPERRNSRLLQSPHCVANCLQHARSNRPGAIMCKSRATHRAVITRSLQCAT